MLFPPVNGIWGYSLANERWMPLLTRVNFDILTLDSTLLATTDDFDFRRQPRARGSRARSRCRYQWLRRWKVDALNSRFVAPRVKHCAATVRCVLITCLFHWNLPYLEIAEKGAKPSDLPMDEMFIAARNKVPEAMQKLIDLGADVKKTYKGTNLYFNYIHLLKVWIFYHYFRAIIKLINFFRQESC